MAGIPIETKIRAMVGFVDGADPLKQEVALKCIINLSFQPQYRDVIIASDGVPRLVSLLEDGEEVHQMLAAWGLSNICSDSEAIQNSVGSSGAVHSCLSIIQGCDNADVLEKVLWLVTNLSRTSQNRRVMFSAGYLPALASLLEKDSQKLQVVELLRNIFQDPISQEEFCGVGQGGTSRALRLLVGGLDDHHPFHVRVEVALTLAVLCSNSDDVRRAVANAGLLHRLKLLLSERVSAEAEEAHAMRAGEGCNTLAATARLHVVWCLTNLSLCADQEGAILAAGLIGPLVDLLSCESPALVAEVAVLLANLSLNDGVREEVRRVGGIPVVSELVQTSGDAAHEADSSFSALLFEVLQLVTNLSVDPNNAYLFDVTKCKATLESLSAKNTGSAEVQSALTTCVSNITAGIAARKKAASKASKPPARPSSSPASATSSAHPGGFASPPSPAPPDTSSTVPRRKSLRFGTKPPLLNKDDDGWRRSAAMAVPRGDPGGRRPSMLGHNRGSPVAPSAVTPSKVVSARESTELVGQLDGKHVRRTNIAQEMLDTERSYVDGLGILIRMYLNPLNEALANGQPILTKDEIRRMFSFVEVIVNINGEFLADLEKRVNVWDEHTEVGDLYLKLCTMLPMYSEYINNYNNAMETMSKCCEENEAFFNFIHQQRALPECKGLDISSYLILPIQRVPRYQMMLVDLLKRTEEDHPDFANLSQAVSRIKDTAEFLNEAKRTSENLAKVVAVQAKLTGFPGSLVQADRKLLIEGECLLSTHGGPSKYIYLLLFSDAILFTDKRKNKLKYRSMLTLSSVRVINKNDTEVLKNAIQIVGTTPVGEAADFTVYFSNPEDKQTWLVKMKDAVHTRKKSEFEMKAARSTKSLLVNVE